MSDIQIDGEQEIDKEQEMTPQEWTGQLILKELQKYLRAKKKAQYDPLPIQQLAQAYILDNQIQPLKYRDKLYRWTGTRYVEEREINDKVRRYLTAKKKTHSNNIIGNVVPAIGALAYKDSQVYPSMPFYFGEGDFPKPENVIAFKNGLLNVVDYIDGCRTLIPHTSKWASTFCLPHHFDPAATCPGVLAWLKQAFKGDEDKEKLLTEWYGLGLTPDTSYEKLLLKIGPPRAGKGITDRIQMALLGKENYTGFNLHSLADKFGPRKLLNKLVAFVGEVNLANSRDKNRILESLNSIVGRDSIDIEEKFGVEGLSQQLTTRFSLSCNEMPHFVEAHGALSARLLILNYNQSFVGREDRDLANRLLTEISGVTNLALQGLVRLKLQGGFTMPASTKRLVNEFRRDSSDVFAFAQDCLVVRNDCNPGNLDGVRLTNEPVEVRGSVLLQRWMEWRADNDLPIDKPDNYGSRVLMRNLRTMLDRDHFTSKRIDGKTEQMYYGIGIRVD
jgi:hypothetical protein